MYIQRTLTCLPADGYICTVTVRTNRDKRNVTQKGLFHEGGVQRSANIADVCPTAEKVCTTVQTIIKPTMLLEPTAIEFADSCEQPVDKHSSGITPVQM